MFIPEHSNLLRCGYFIAQFLFELITKQKNFVYLNLMEAVFHYSQEIGFFVKWGKETVQTRKFSTAEYIYLLVINAFLAGLKSLFPVDYNHIEIINKLWLSCLQCFRSCNYFQKFSVNLHYITRFICELPHKFIHGILHGFIHVILHRFTHAVHKYTDFYIESFTDFYTESFTDLYMESFMDLYMEYFIDLCMESFIDLYMESFMDL